MNQADFLVENLGENKFLSPLNDHNRTDFYNGERILYNNVFAEKKPIKSTDKQSFERAGPHRYIHFDPTKINVGIVTCGGLCPGLNDVIRAITYNSLVTYKVKTVFGFRFGYKGLTAKYANQAMRLNSKKVDLIHEQGGTILGSSRGSQSIEDIVDTLVKFNISILYVIGGDGTQSGAIAITEEIQRRKLDVAIIGIPKTIDNDISFVHKTFGFDTAVEEARKAINAAHVEAKGAHNGIGLVKLMGRHSGFIANNATLASGNVNICLIPEEEFDLDKVFKKVKQRFEESDHIVIVVAEGAGQDFFNSNKKEQEFDKSGNVKLKDIGSYLKEKLHDHLVEEGIEHTIKYIDPSYLIRSTCANAIDSSFCLRLGNYAVHAGMAGRTNLLISYWNQHFCLVPTRLALSTRKLVDIEGAEWQSVLEITIKLENNKE
ncbi:MAG: ATP-dependent 6-phosphofructokinase [Bacteriovoracaceae bacterium]|nr:ATP-dependent 6-phosphofructokinase [Bacteriovoracaceae bacterium]